MSNIAKKWKALSGEGKWEGLLDPLDADLRSYIIHYGERAAAIGDAFNKQEKSPGYKLSRCPMVDLFSKVGLENNNPYKYTVTNFVYAKSEVKLNQRLLEEESSWIAYVAVATDEGTVALGRRDILISWRGTLTEIETKKDLESLLISASDVFGQSSIAIPRVHYGFHSIYTTKDPNSAYSKSSAREQVLKEVNILAEKYRNQQVSITVTGHSMGATLAILNAVDIVANGHNKPTGETDKAFPVTAIVFASPRLGDDGFKKVFEELKDNLHVLRISNAKDPVPQIPIIEYVHVGEELIIDTTMSTYLKDDKKESTVHNMEVYLHGVSAMQGRNSFNWAKITRDYSLINKSTDALDDKYKVPAEWWIEKNKGMIQLANGYWKLDDYKPDPPAALYNS